MALTLGQTHLFGGKLTVLTSLWSAAVADILYSLLQLLQNVPSPSLLKASFGPQQDASLNDYIEAALMLQYNDH